MVKRLLRIFAVVLCSLFNCCKSVHIDYYDATVISIEGYIVTVAANGKEYTFEYHGSGLQAGDIITIGVPDGDIIR